MTQRLKLPHSYYQRVIHLLGTVGQAMAWFKQANPYLNMLSPYDAIRGGKLNDVQNLIDKGNVKIAEHTKLYKA